jgi:hypothetical protein
MSLPTTTATSSGFGAARAVRFRLPIDQIAQLAALSGEKAWLDKLMKSLGWREGEGFPSLPPCPAPRTRTKSETEPAPQPETAQGYDLCEW